MSVRIGWGRIAAVWFTASYIGSGLSIGATLSGQVQQSAPSGQMVPNARMTLFTPSLSYFRETRSDGAGAYVFADVPNGTYQLGCAAFRFEYVEQVVQATGGDFTHDFSIVDEAHPGQWDIIGNTSPEVLDATDIAVLLPDGRIFYCHDTEDPILFDPVTGTKTFPSGSSLESGCMNGGLLPDGTVLFAGGQDGDQPGQFTNAVRWVKKYAPSSDSWLRLADLQHPLGRWYPGMARLSDGSFLVMGGGQCCNAARTDTAERFDLATQTWSSTGSMINPVEFPPSALLYSGEVLITWSPAQLYNPTTGQWRLTGDFNQPNRGWPGHSDHSIVVLEDGRVLAIGVLKGPNNNSFMGEVYDPSTESWSLTSNPDLVRFQAEVVQLPDGRVFVGGGETEAASPPVPTSLGIVKWTDLYDPATDSWRRVADMNHFREYHAVTLLIPDGRVVTTGGTRIKFQVGPTSNDIEAYSPPYLFRGVRPKIISVSSTTPTRGGPLLLGISPQTQVTSVVLIGAQTTTHWVDSGIPRRLALPFVQSNSTVTATLPTDPNVLPLGHYLVFANVDDIPSEAVIVQVMQQEPAVPAISATGLGVVALLLMAAGAFVLVRNGGGMTSRRAMTVVFVAVWMNGMVSHAQQVYWSDNYSRTLRRVNADGSNAEVLIAPPLEWPVGLALHPTQGRVYWTDYQTRKIQSARLDGTDVRDVRTPEDGMLTPRGIALDPASGKMYWSEKDFDTFLSYIRRADLNGDNVETLLTRTGEPYALALDLSHDRIYWTEAGNWGVWRANLDGTDPLRLISTSIGVPGGIALDVVGGKLYWVNGGSQNRIERANLDGSDRETIFPNACNPLGIALDLAAGRVFWSDTCSHGVWSAALDGSGAAPFAEFQEVWALAVDPDAAKLYSAAVAPIPVRRIALDGSQPEELIVSLAADVRGLVLSHAEGFLYWWREGTRIYRSRFDGSDAELFRSLNGFGYAVRGLGLDGVAGRLYWVLYNPDSEIYELQSVGLNGKGFQAVAVDEFDGILDVVYSRQRSKLYFVNISPCSISAFRQTGGVAELVHSDPKACPAGLTLDASRGHLYWGEPDLNEIRRSNLDGQSVESIPILDVGLPVSLGVAPFVGELFWIDSLASSIRRGPIAGGPSIGIVPLDFNTSPGGFVVDSRSPGDADADGLVNLADFRIFQNCFTGPTPRRLRPECVFFDTPPVDSDIDDADWEFLYPAFPGGHAFRR